MSIEDDIQELKDMMAGLKQENATLKTRLSEVEDFAQTHIGMDWGTAGLSANTSHPNLSVDTGEFGGGVSKIDIDGITMAAPEAGTGPTTSPDGARIIWKQETLTGDTVADISGAHSTPGGVVDQNALYLRAFKSTDWTDVKVGAWDDDAEDWLTVFGVRSATSSTYRLYAEDENDNFFFGVTRTDADNYVLYIRKGGALVAISGGLLGDTAWAAAGDLVYGTGNDTATILSHPGSAGLVLTSTTGPNAISWAAAAGGSFSYGKAITTSQGQNLP